jgi:DNA-binding beta-propeller fold protein YncE
MKALVFGALVFTSFQTRADTLIVLNKSDNTASLVDLDSLKTVVTLNTGIGPHEVAVSENGKTAVITNYGNAKAGNSLTVIDVSLGKVESTIHLGKFTRPHGVSWIRNSDQVLVTAEDQKAILRIDVKKEKILSSIPTDQDVSHMLTIDSNISSNSISVLDLEKNEKIKDLHTGKGSEGISFNSKSNEIWVTNRSEDSISIIDAKSLAIKSKLESHSFPIRVKFSEDLGLALITNAQSGDLNVFDVESQKLSNNIKFPKGVKETAGRMFGDKFKDSSVPIGIAIDHKRNRAFIAHANLDEISILDLKRLKLVGKIVAGKEPDGMAYSGVHVRRNQ